MMNLDRRCGATLTRPPLLARQVIERLHPLMVDSIAKAFLSHPSQIFRPAAAAIEY
jgi:hypothetical protein